MNIQEIESKMRSILQEAKNDGECLGSGFDCGCDCVLKICARRHQLDHLNLTDLAWRLFDMSYEQAFALMSGWDGPRDGRIRFDDAFSMAQDGEYFHLGNKLAEEFYRPVVNANA
jgi:hypothetical protein